MKKVIKLMILIGVVAIFVLSFRAIYASVSDNLNYQGKLKDSAGNPITSPTTIQFSLYSHITNGSPSDVPSQSGPLLWSETYDGSNPNCSQITPGTDGIFAQHLGDCVAFPSYLDFTKEYYLGVKVGSDAEATPRVPLTTNPYSFTSKRLHVEGGDLYITNTDVTGDILINTAGGLQITGSNAIFPGAVYNADYSANYTNRSLVDKEYVDSQLMWEILPASTGGMRIQPKNNSVRQIFVQRDDNSYTQFKVRNDNDAGNGAGAIIELKGSGADYTNNMYIGKYGASFWIPELRDNGAVLTDKNLIIGTASGSHEIHFVTGNSYNDLRPVVVADNEGFRYTSDLSATFVDRTLVDKEYVDNAITGGANNIYTNDGTLTGDRTVTSNGNSLEFTGTNNSYSFTASNGATNDTQLNIGDDEIEIATLDGVSSSSMVYNPGQFQLSTNGPGGSLGLTLGTNMMFSDTLNSRGVEYAADYSANYTNRSLVDKEYVDDAINVAAPFRLSGNIISNSNGGSYATDDFVFGSPSLDDDGDADHDSRLFFDKSSGAFRVGTATGNQWDIANVGSHSVAMGNNNISSGSNAVAFGSDSTASGNNSFASGIMNSASGLSSLAIGELADARGWVSVAMGGQTTAYDDFAIAIGLQAEAYLEAAIAIGDNTRSHGESSVAIGDHIQAYSLGEVALGSYENGYTVGTNGTTQWNATDRAFVVANGQSHMARSNALVILKNGTITAPDFSIAEINTAGNTALTTKEYVDNAILTGANTLYLADGTLAADRTVTGNNHSLSMTGLSSLYQEVSSGGDTSYIEVGSDELLFGTTVAAGSSSAFGAQGDNAYMQVDNGAGSLSSIVFRTTDMTVADQINLKGLVYADDYSANYTNRSLVDKEYVDTQVTNGVTASNGLNKVGPDIKLGGSLSQYTVVDKNDNGVLFTGLGTFGVRYGTGTTYPHLDIGFHSFELGYHTASDDVSLGVSMGGKMTMTDTRHLTGIEYAADYSANYTNRTLVDKEYVDNAIVAGANNIYNNDGIINESRNVIVAGGNGYTLSFKNTDVGLNFDEDVLSAYGEDGNHNSTFEIGSNNVIFNSFDSSDEKHSYLSLDHVNGVRFESNTDGIMSHETRINMDSDDIVFSRVGTATFKGATYDVDYSANYTNRSLVDKGYVDGLVSSNTYWTRTGTNLSPTTAGDDILLNTGETLSIADLTQGSIPFIGASGLVTQDNSNLFWDSNNNRLAIGSNTPSEALDISGNARIRSIGSGAYSAPVNQMADGTLTTATSDRRFKKNITTIDDALDKVRQLRGVTYNWKDEQNKKRMTGMIAQEVNDVMPELVFKNSTDDYYGIFYGETSGLLVEAIKELDKKQEEKNTALKSKISKTKSKLKKLRDLENDREDNFSKINKKLDNLDESSSSFEQDISRNRSDLIQFSNELNISKELFKGNEQKIAKLEETLNEIKVHDSLVTKIIDGAKNVVEKVVFTAEIKFKDVVTFFSDVEFLEKVIFHKRTVFEDKDMAGTAVVKEGKDSAQVDFESEFKTIPFVTATANNNYYAFKIDNINKKGFEIKVEENAKEDLIFTWHALAVKKENSKINEDEEENKNKEKKQDNKKEQQKKEDDIEEKKDFSKTEGEKQGNKQEEGSETSKKQEKQKDE